ncbi:MerR family transcriptional regulator [soil metagenome]
MINSPTVAIAELTVGELSRRSGVPVRTVRFYQTRYLLPPPERIGREVRYDQRHLDRLALIAELQDRGLRLSAIADLLRHAGEDHTSLLAWLGLGETLQRSWTNDRPALLTEVELRDRIGDDTPGTVAALERAGLVERRADTTPVTFLVPSPALLDIAVELRDAGIDLDTSAATRILLQRRLGRLADELVAEVTERVSMSRLAEEGPAALADLIERVRPATRRAVEVVFAHEMERALRDIAETGPRQASGRRRGGHR